MSCSFNDRHYFELKTVLLNYYKSEFLEKFTESKVLNLLSNVENIRINPTFILFIRNLKSTNFKYIHAPILPYRKLTGYAKKKNKRVSYMHEYEESSPEYNENAYNFCMFPYN